MSEPICTCTELERMTVCHDIRNEPHLVGCPRWGTPKNYATGGYIDGDSAPLLDTTCYWPARRDGGMES